MGPSMGSGVDPPSMTNTAVDHIASDTEVWCEPLRTTLYHLENLECRNASARSCYATTLRYLRVIRICGRKTKREYAVSYDVARYHDHSCGDTCLLLYMRACAHVRLYVCASICFVVWSVGFACQSPRGATPHMDTGSLEWQPARHGLSMSSQPL